jgi:hypothetical protein
MRNDMSGIGTDGPVRLALIGSGRMGRAGRAVRIDEVAK